MMTFTISFFGQFFAFLWLNLPKIVHPPIFHNSWRTMSTICHYEKFQQIKDDSQLDDKTVILRGIGQTANRLMLSTRRNPQWKDYEFYVQVKSNKVHMLSQSCFHPIHRCYWNLPNILPGDVSWATVQKQNDAPFPHHWELICGTCSSQQFQEIMRKLDWCFPVHLAWSMDSSTPQWPALSFWSIRFCTNKDGRKFLDGDV